MLLLITCKKQNHTKWHCSEVVKIRGGGLAFSYLLDENSDNETKRNETVINRVK